MADDWSNDMALPVATGLTIADLDAMPEDSVVRALIDGELFVTPAPTIRHQRVVTEMLWRLRSYAEREGGVALTAPAAVRLSDSDMPVPDVLYVRREHLDRVGERYIEGAPDLVIEVSSPSTRRFDLLRKGRLYERFGVVEYWFVDLDAERIEQYALGGGRYLAPVIIERRQTLSSVALDGCRINVDDVLS